MTYATFLFKHILKNKLSYLPLILVLLACLGTLFLNAQTYEQNSRVAQAHDNIARNTVLMAEAEERLKQLEQGTAEYDSLIKNIQITKDNLKRENQLLEAIETGDWGTVYDTEAKVLSDYLELSQEQTESRDQLLEQALERDIKLYKELQKVDFTYEDSHLPSTATQFSLSLFRYILPALLPVGLAYVLTNLYGSAYEGRLDKNRLLPESLLSVTLKNIAVGSSYSLLTLLAILTPVVLVSGFAYGWGNLNYPILFYSLTTKEMYFSAIGQVLVPTITLHALSLVFMTVLIYLMTILTKNKMTALFISTIVLLSGIALPSVLAPVSAVAHLIPTTYVRSFDITTGVFQHGIENFQVNTGLGIGVLLTSTVALVLLCLLAQKPKNNLRITA